MEGLLDSPLGSGTVGCRCKAMVWCLGKGGAGLWDISWPERALKDGVKGR